jgi:hypothetical protein
MGQKQERFSVIKKDDQNTAVICLNFLVNWMVNLKAEVSLNGVILRKLMHLCRGVPTLFLSSMLQG